VNQRRCYEDFTAPPGPEWQRHIAGGGALEPTGSSLRFVGHNACLRCYSNAQIDDYQNLHRRHFLWQPPVKLTVRARFSHPEAGSQPGLLGTAGFGFWNDPFVMTGGRLLALPRAVWFFYASPPSDLRLDPDVPGWGWTAMSIDTLRREALGWAALSPLLVPLMNLRPIYPALWRPIQRTLRIGVAKVPVDMTRWYTYRLEWGLEQVRFYVSGQAGTILEVPSPHGPMGLVLWLDNQYMVATPWGKLRWGRLNIPGRQWMEVDELTIDPL
jgi:hypothetical protein